jgi:hypothetical protein
VYRKAIPSTHNIKYSFRRKKQMANKWVYLFSEGNANMRELLGGKGANLAEMTGLDFQYLRDSQLQQKLVLSIMRMAERSMKKFRVRSMNTS